jgi:DNA primase
MQHPGTMTTAWGDVEAEDFVHPYYRAIFDAVVSLGGPGQATPDVVTDKVADPAVTSLVSALAVEPLHVTGEPDEKVGSAYVVRLRELTALRRIDQVKSKLQRMNPVTQTTEYNRMFGELVALESHRRSLREQAIGTGI